MNISAKHALALAMCVVALVPASAYSVAYPAPQPTCATVSTSDAVHFLHALFTTINKCQPSGLSSLLTPDFKQYVFGGIRSRTAIVALLTRICYASTTPTWKPRLLHRIDARTFAVEVKVFKGYTLLFTLNNSYTLVRDPATGYYKLESSVNVLRASDLAPFGI